MTTTKQQRRHHDDDYDEKTTRRTTQPPTEQTDLGDACESFLFLPLCLSVCLHNAVRSFAVGALTGLTVRTTSEFSSCCCCRRRSWQIDCSLQTAVSFFSLASTESAPHVSRAHFLLSRHMSCLIVWAGRHTGSISHIMHVCVWPMTKRTQKCANFCAQMSRHRGELHKLSDPNSAHSRQSAASVWLTTVA